MIQISEALCLMTSLKVDRDLFTLLVFPKNRKAEGYFL